MCDVLFKQQANACKKKTFFFKTVPRLVFDPISSTRILSHIKETLAIIQTLLLK